MVLIISILCLSNFFWGIENALPPLFLDEYLPKVMVSVDIPYDKECTSDLVYYPWLENFLYLLVPFWNLSDDGDQLKGLLQQLIPIWSSPRFQVYFWLGMVRWLIYTLYRRWLFSFDELFQFSDKLVKSLAVWPTPMVGKDERLRLPEG